MTVRRRIGALVLLAALAAPPLAVARVAWADAAPAGSSTSVTVKQINQALGLLLMVFKLAEFLGTVELPPQGGPPDPQWGSHPGPLPSLAPPGEQSQSADPPVREPVPA